MLSHYNLNYSLKPEDIDKFDVDYSGAVTTIPMKSLKGFFYMKDGRYREAIDLFNEEHLVTLIYTSVSHINHMLF